MPSVSIDKLYTVYPDDIPVTVQVCFYIVCDPQYGADADGRRGIPDYSIEDVEIVMDETEPAIADDGVTVLTKAQLALVEKLVDQKLANEDLYQLFSDRAEDYEERDED